MKLISKDELLAMMLKHKSASPVGLVTITETKDINGLVYSKFSTPNGMIGFNYENSVNNAQERKGEDRDFVAQPRKWGKHLNAQVIEHKGKHYLQVKVQKTRKPFYMKDGRIYTSIEIKKRETPNHGVIVRDYSLDNIKQIAYKGERYKVK